MSNYYFTNQMEDFLETVKDLQSYGYKKIVLTGGHFNLCHGGHIDLIREAAHLGDVLIVAVNSDQSSIRKSGYSLLSIEDRMKIVNEFIHVDLVIENPYDDMCHMIESIKPHVYAKGGDRFPENMLQDELKSCEEIGCQVIYGVGGNKSQSSSIILESYWKYRQSRHEFTETLNKLKDI